MSVLVPTKLAVNGHRVWIEAETKEEGKNVKEYAEYRVTLNGVHLALDEKLEEREGVDLDG